MRAKKPDAPEAFPKRNRGRAYALGYIERGITKAIYARCPHCDQVSKVQTVNEKLVLMCKCRN